MNPNIFNMKDLVKEDKKKELTRSLLQIYCQNTRKWIEFNQKIKQQRDQELEELFSDVTGLDFSEKSLFLPQTDYNFDDDGNCTKLSFPGNPLKSFAQFSSMDLAHIFFNDTPDKFTSLIQ